MASPDFGSIISALNASTALTAVVSAAAVLAVVAFSSWGAKSVARFFDSDPYGDRDSFHSDRSLDGWYSGRAMDYQFDQDRNAIYKSVDRHMRKSG